MKSFAWHLTRKLIVFGSIVLAIGMAGILYYMQFELPDIEALKTTPVQAPLRIYTHSGKLIAEYGEKRSDPIPFTDIPPQLINAILATEDEHYFQHPGVDATGLLRAGIKLILTGKRAEGGSTITMQVARNFYLTRYKTFGRKFQEILLAIKIDHTLTKQKILELYLNTVFLGNRAYGVGAAAEIYYGKPLKQLSLDQYATLAGLPKAPSTLNPIVDPVAAKKRRDHVLNRMYEQSYIDANTYQAALRAPVKAVYHELQVETKAPYAAELARKQLEEMYGDGIYTDGYNVYTTIDNNLQEDANIAVRDNLMAYDKRHGYRGPEKNVSTHDLNTYKKILATIPAINTIEPAIVIRVTNQTATALRTNGTVITIPWQGLSWARHQVNSDYLGRVPNDANAILKVGDVIRIMPAKEGFRLAQLPKAQAGMIVLNPLDGEIRALVGGFDFQLSSFDRMTDAQRQPGSSFKPFIYSAALEKGFTLASIVNDAPIVVENTGENSLWRPQNDTHLFYGPISLRDALVHSRNLASIRLLQQIEIPYTVDYVKRFGFSATQIPASLSMALGTASVTPMDMATAYAVFANNGFKVTPYIIENIRNTQGQIIYQAKPLMACQNCTAPQVISPQNAYLITSALHDVIQAGTAADARRLQRHDLAGKTGTTNNQVDAWFIGYNTNMVALSWVGYDQPHSLHEYGAQAALPMWIQFMAAALKDQPDHNIQQPPGIMSIRIDPTTGSLASADNPHAVFEYFMEPYLPTNDIENKPDANSQTTESGSVY